MVEATRIVRRFTGAPGAVIGFAMTIVLAVTGLFAGSLAPFDPFAPAAPAFTPPSWSNPFGTDDLGRDLLSGVIHGTRTSMLVVATVVAVSTLIGVAVGTVAGYRGGIVDDLLMRVTEVVQSIPRFFLAILVVALLGAGLDNIILVLALTSWPWLARIVRAETLSVRELDFVESARASGATHRRILLRHIVPSLVPTVMVVATLTAARVILLEASLSFLGLGDPNAISWGYLVNNAQRFVRFAWWMSVFPGVAIVVAVLALHLLSDGIADATDPVRAEVV